jgi:DNA polymerase I
VSKYFSTIVVCDFEYEIADGDLPNVLCMVAHVLDPNLQHVRTITLWRGVEGKALPLIETWRGEFGKEPPFDIGDNTLFVAYSAWAELTCFMVLGWKFPRHVYDAHTAFLAKTNVLLPYDPDEKRKKERKRLSDACRRYGIEGWERIEKEVIAKDIGEGNWQKYGREAVVEYCGEDVRGTNELLRRQIRDPEVDIERNLFWAEYSAKATAQIQARGMPIDMPLWNMVQENKQAVVTALRRRFDPSFHDDEPIFDAEGHWDYNRFAKYLIRNKITHWPRIEKSGALGTKGDDFRMMYHLPGIERLHALKDSVRVIATTKLPIGRDARNRASLFPFATATGRNAHSKSLYNSHAGMRCFMRFPEDKIGLYLDWKAQEIGIAAALSGDPALIEAYGTDVYHALALMCGLTDDPDWRRWKKEHKDMRNRMKALQLGINYGMSVPSLARGLDRHPFIASTFIDLHQRRHPVFWKWRNNVIDRAMLDRRTETVFGWSLHLSTEPNQRTLMNFACQGNGAEMLRLASVRLCEAGLVPCMLIHDGILFELDNEEQVEHAKEIMRSAGRDVCNGFEIGVDEDQRLVGGKRYADGRDVAKEMWRTIMEALKEVGALP